jgi:hypothetical protein
MVVEEEPEALMLAVPPVMVSPVEPVIRPVAVKASSVFRVSAADL